MNFKLNLYGTSYFKFGAAGARGEFVGLTYALKGVNQGLRPRCSRHSPFSLSRRVSARRRSLFRRILNCANPIERLRSAATRLDTAWPAFDVGDVVMSVVPDGEN